MCKAKKGFQRLKQEWMCLSRLALGSTWKGERHVVILDCTCQISYSSAHHGTFCTPRLGSGPLVGPRAGCHKLCRYLPLDGPPFSWNANRTISGGRTNNLAPLSKHGLPPGTLKQPDCLAVYQPS